LCWFAFGGKNIIIIRVSQVGESNSTNCSATAIISTTASSKNLDCGSAGPGPEPEICKSRANTGADFNEYDESCEASASIGTAMIRACSVKTGISGAPAGGAVCADSSSLVPSVGLGDGCTRTKSEACAVTVNPPPDMPPRHSHFSLATVNALETRSLLSNGSLAGIECSRTGEASRLRHMNGTDAILPSSSGESRIFQGTLYAKKKSDAMTNNKSIHSILPKSIHASNACKVPIKPYVSIATKAQDNFNKHNSLLNAQMVNPWYKVSSSGMCVDPRTPYSQCTDLPVQISAQNQQTSPYIVGQHDQGQRKLTRFLSVCWDCGFGKYARAKNGPRFCREVLRHTGQDYMNVLSSGDISPPKNSISGQNLNTTADIQTCMLPSPSSIAAQVIPGCSNSQMAMLPDVTSANSIEGHGNVVPKQIIKLISESSLPAQEGMVNSTTSDSVADKQKPNNYMSEENHVKEPTFQSAEIVFQNRDISDETETKALEESAIGNVSGPSLGTTDAIRKVIVDLDSELYSPNASYELLIQVAQVWVYCSLSSVISPIPTEICLFAGGQG
jgi:hypothetical protein